MLTWTEQGEITHEALTALVREALEEDLGRGDVTTRAIVPHATVARARLVAKQDAVLAGLAVFEHTFRILDPEIQFQPQACDGNMVGRGAEIARLEGSARAILSAERTALNLLTHLSGIATLTRRFVDAVAGTSARIRDTRKTLPGLRALEKYAVVTGGGASHRFGLFDAILIKENHIAVAGSITEALRRAQAHAPRKPEPPETTAYESFRPPAKDGLPAIEIEVRSEAELREALAAGAEFVLLDNASPAGAAQMVRSAREQRPGCLVEVSGGVTLTNVRAYAEAGVDFISVGALTHSAPSADLSLLVQPVARE